MDGIKSLLASRKFWLAIVAITVSAVFVALGKIESKEFLGLVLAIVGGLAGMITAEDTADKIGAGKAIAAAAAPPPVTVNTGSPGTIVRNEAPSTERETPPEPRPSEETFKP